MKSEHKVKDMCVINASTEVKMRDTWIAIISQMHTLDSFFEKCPNLRV